MKKHISTIASCLLVLTLLVGVVQVSAANETQGPALPPVLVAGNTYTVPAYEGTAYVNGEEAGATFVAEGSAVTISYKSGDEVLFTASVPVIDTDSSANHTAYFYDPSGKLKAEETADYMVLSAASDAQAVFANGISAATVTLNLEFDYKKADFGSFVVKLTDALDANVSLTFHIDHMNETITYGNETVTLPMSGSMVMLKYTNSSRLLQETSGETALFTPETDDLGAPFDGFSGGVYLTLGFENVTGKAAVNLKRLQNQPLGHRDTFIPDATEPQIVLDGNIASNLGKGAMLQIPGFTAYDIFSPIAEKLVKVLSPAGEELFCGSIEDYSPIEITENGKYSVVFCATDTHGNKTEVSKSVFVNDDVAPELTVSPMEKTEFALGDTVTIPGYTARDNLDVCYVDVILILPDSQMYMLSHDDNGTVTYTIKNTDVFRSSFGVSDTSFRATQRGTYTLRFVAYDNIYNRTVVEVPFTVK